MTVCKAVALRISKLLIEKNMTLYRLEQNSGVLHGTMAGIMSEKNKSVDFTTIIMIAKGFEMSIEEFVKDPLFKFENFELF